MCLTSRRHFYLAVERVRGEPVSRTNPLYRRKFVLLGVRFVLYSAETLMQSQSPAIYSIFMHDSEQRINRGRIREIAGKEQGILSLWFPGYTATTTSEKSGANLCSGYAYTAFLQGTESTPGPAFRTPSTAEYH